jgi:hypothetical protein
LDGEYYLSNEENQAKSEIHNLLNKLHQLNEEFIQESAKIESICHDHFSELRRQIDIHREQLKAKIDEIALDMIKKAKKQESEFYQNLKEIQQMKFFNFEDEKLNLDEIFKKVDLNIDQVKQLKLENEIGIKSLQAKMVDLNGLKVEIKKMQF